MPVRALDKREVTEAERWAICKTANLCIVLKPDFKCFKVPLHELRQEMWGKTISNSISEGRPILFLTGFHSAIFAFLALYLNHLPLLPAANLCFTFTGYDAAMSFDDYTLSTEASDIAMGQLSNASFDDQPDSMPVARRLLFAYILGQKLGTPHFQDAIMNAIVKFFRPDGPPSPAFIAWLYENCITGRPLGLKKFFVDFYNWARSVGADRLPELNEYIPAFQDDANRAAANTNELVQIDPKDPLERKEQADVIIDFRHLQTVLCNDRQGRLKCRYHHHKAGNMCFHLIVEDCASASV